MDKPVTLLIVDDEEGVVRNLAAYFEDEGFKILTAYSGEKALDILDKNKIDAAIVDMRLPGINGNEVVSQAFAQGNKVKFIIHTGSTDYKLPKILTEFGLTYNQVFLKPVADMAQLKSAILQLLAEQ